MKKKLKQLENEVKEKLHEEKEILTKKQPLIKIRRKKYNIADAHIERRLFWFYRRLELKHQIFFAILIAAAVIAFWRGLWGLMDLYIIPENKFLSYIVSMIIGLAILGFTHYIMDELY